MDKKYVTTFPFVQDGKSLTGVLLYGDSLKPFMRQCEKINWQQSILEEKVRYSKSLNNDSTSMD